MQRHAENRKASYDALLAQTGLTLLECVCLGKCLSEQRQSMNLPPQLSLVRDATLYAQALQSRALAGTSITFRAAVQLHILGKRERRARTRGECRNVLQRMMRLVPGLADTKVCSLRADRCRAIIEQAFATPAMRLKARRILHNFFENARFNNWCDSNPVAGLQFSTAAERPIAALTIAQVERLLRTLHRPEHAACTAAVALMLWAGVRPYEVARLHWADVDLTERVLYINPAHSKTGGARQVPLRAPLPLILRAAGKGQPQECGVVPRNWTRRWKALRRAAGFERWVPDTLRHTFASYHFKRFGNSSQLQWEMGHTGQELLRTRYLNMRGITAGRTRRFWSTAIWQDSAR